MKFKIIRASTVAMSLDVLLPGQLKFLNRYFNVIAVSGHDSHLERVKTREKVKTFSISMQRQISPLQDLISLIKLYFLFKREKPEIVHSITPKAGLLCMAASYFAGVPIRIHTFTGLIFTSKTGIFRFLLLNMDKLLCLFATNIYPEGEGVRQDLIINKVTNKALKVLANGNVNGIDLQHYCSSHFDDPYKHSFKKRLGIKHDDFVYIFVGRLVTDKGINELVKAFISLNLEYPQIKLLLLGSVETEFDPLDAETIQSIEENSNIISVGFQQDVRPYFAVSDSLVFPSYREGFPNVVIQAGAMGLPSIVSDINGCNEIIVNKENGIIVPAKSTDKLLEAMRKCIEDASNLQRMTGNARRMIEERYEQKVVWNAILSEYNKLLSHV